jgi:hypothetical protein
VSGEKAPALGRPEDLRSRCMLCETKRGDMSVRKAESREGDAVYFGCGEVRGRFVIVFGRMSSTEAVGRVVVYECLSLNTRTRKGQYVHHK